MQNLGYNPIADFVHLKPQVLTKDHIKARPDVGNTLIKSKICTSKCCSQRGLCNPLTPLARLARHLVPRTTQHTGFYEEYPVFTMSSDISYAQQELGINVFFPALTLAFHRPPIVVIWALRGNAASVPQFHGLLESSSNLSLSAHSPHLCFLILRRWLHLSVFLWSAFGKSMRFTTCTGNQKIPNTDDFTHCRAALFNHISDLQILSYRPLIMMLPEHLYDITKTSFHLDIISILVMALEFLMWPVDCDGELLV